MRVPNNWCGGQWPLGGNTYAGLYAYDRGGEYREYIETALTSPMLPGQLYKISFNVSLADKSRDCIASLGAFISVGEATAPNNSVVAMPYSPQIINTSGPICDDTNWTLISGTYVAAGGEDHITIGNFSPDAGLQVTHHRGLQGRKLRGAYYYIDDVSVTCECTAPPAIQTQPVSQTVACGQGASLSGSAHAPCGASYRWICDNCYSTPTVLVNNSLFSGATTNTLTLSPTAATQFHGKTFRLQSYNTCGSTNSAGVTINTIPPPLITEPTDIFVCPPDEATFTVAGTGSPLTYAWYWIPAGQSTPIAFPAFQGGTSSTLSFPSNPSHCGASVYCDVTGPCGTIRSRQALIQCCDCALPPTNMALWLPFDQVAVVSGNGVTRNVVSGYGGVLLPTTSGPVLAAGQFAGNSLFFDGVDDLVRVQSHSLVDIDQGDLTVDAWISLQSDSPGLFVVTDKRLESGGTRGYHMFIQSNGPSYRVGFQLADGLFTNYLSLPDPALVPGRWNHLAVTVDRDSATGGRFYVNGAPAGVFDPTARQGSLSNPSPFTVGARSTVPSGFFIGYIDEVEVFPRVLSAAQVASIAGAKAMGKCKQFCQTYPPTIWCDNNPSTTIGAYVFNFTPGPVTFPGVFTTLSCPFTPSNLPLPVTVPVPAWSWGQVSVLATRPAMTAGGTACYVASFVGSAGTFSCSGSIVNRPDIDCQPFPLAAARVIPFGDHADVHFSFRNLGNASGIFPWRAEAMGPDGETTRALSINGAPPGSALAGESFVPIGASIDLTLDVSFAQVDALGMTLLLLSTDTDRDGVFDAAAASSLLCAVSVPCAPVILRQPSSVSTCPAGTATFSVTAAGTDFVDYQWQWRPAPTSAWRDVVEQANSDDLGVTAFDAQGATTTTLVVHAHGAGGAFRCIVTNACGSVTSSEATCTICPADFNCSGAVSVQDMFDFFTKYFSNDSHADFNKSGAITVQDIFDFLAAYFAGCP